MLSATFDIRIHGFMWLRLMFCVRLCINLSAELNSGTCVCFQGCSHEDLRVFWGVLPLRVNTASSTWFPYLSAIYGETLPLPFNFSRLRFFYHSPWYKSPLHSCSLTKMNVTTALQCDQQTCSKWYHSAENDQHVRRNETFDTLRKELGTIFFLVDDVNEPLIPHTYVEVFRTQDAQEQLGRGTWFYLVHGSGIFLNTGRVMKLSSSFESYYQVNHFEFEAKYSMNLSNLEVISGLLSVETHCAHRVIWRKYVNRFGMYNCPLDPYFVNDTCLCSLPPIFFWYVSGMPLYLRYVKPEKYPRNLLDLLAEGAAGMLGATRRTHTDLLTVLPEWLRIKNLVCARYCMNILLPLRQVMNDLYPYSEGADEPLAQIMAAEVGYDSIDFVLDPEMVHLRGTHDKCSTYAFGLKICVEAQNTCGHRLGLRMGLEKAKCRCTDKFMDLNCFEHTSVHMQRYHTPRPQQYLADDFCEYPPSAR